MPATFPHAGTALDVRFYSADGRKRRKTGPLRVLPGSSWRLSRTGGYADAQLVLTGRTTKDLAEVQENDRVRVFVKGTLRYSGFVAQPARRLGISPTLAITCQGKWSQIALVPVNGRFISPFATDIVDAFASFAHTEAQQAYPDLTVSVAAPLGVSVSIEDAANKNLGDTFAQMDDRLQGLAAYGCDEISDAPSPTGAVTNRVIQDRLYLRAISELTRPDYTLPVPGRWRDVATVTDATGGPDLSRVVNILTVTGAANQYPNLLAQACAGNVGFEQPNFADTQAENKFTNSGFEQNFPNDLQGWNATGGAAKKSRGLTEGETRSGSNMCELDQINERIHQTVTMALVQGDSIAAGVFARREFAAASAATFTITIQFKNGGADVGSPSVLTISPDAAGTWQPYTGYAVAPAGTLTGYDVEYRLTAKTGAQGVVLDDAYTYKANLIQEGWKGVAEGSATFNTLNWVAPEAAIQGRYGVYVDVSASDSDGNDARLEPTGRFSVTPSTALVGAASFRSPPGVSANGKINLELRFYDAGGAEISGSGFLYSIAAGAGWATKTQVATTAHTVPSNAASADFRVNFRGNTKVYVDALLVRNSACPTITDRDTSQSVIEWIPDGPYTNTFYVTDGDVSSLLTAKARTSITDYGKRFGQIQSDAVYNRTTALVLAAAYLNVYAPALAAPVVTIKGCPVAMKPGQTVRLAGKAGPWLGADETVRGRAYPIAEVEERVGNAGDIETTLSLELPQPTVERLVRQIFTASRQGTTGGGVTSFTTSGGGGGGGFSPIAPTQAGYQSVSQSGTALTQRSTLNFTGAGVTASDDSGNAQTTVNIPGSSLTLSWAGTALTGRPTLNVIGTPAAAPVAVYDNAALNRTDIYVPQLATEHLIQEVRLAASQASVSFTGILAGLQGMAGFRHLRLVVSGRGDKAATFVETWLRFNGDSSSNYDHQDNVANNATMIPGATAAGDHIFIGWIPAATAPANQSSYNETIIYDYRGTTFQKMSSSRGAVKTSNAAAGLFSLVSEGWWRNTAAITQVTILPDSGNFIAGTLVSLYGLR